MEESWSKWKENRALVMSCSVAASRLGSLTVQLEPMTFCSRGCH